VVVPDEHVGREAGRPQDLLLLDHVEALGEAPIEVRERGLQLGLPAYDQTPIGDRNAFPQLELQVEDAFHVPRIDAASVDPEPQRPRGHGMEPSALLPAWRAQRESGSDRKAAAVARDEPRRVRRRVNDEVLIEELQACEGRVCGKRELQGAFAHRIGRDHGPDIE
jgi:hypothetical protein